MAINKCCKKQLKIKKAKKSKKSSEEENSSTGYYALLEEGDKKMKQKDYTAAKLNFEKALRCEGFFITLNFKK